MRSFLLGVLAGVTVVALALGLLVLSATQPGGAAAPAPTPSATASHPPRQGLRTGETWFDAVHLESGSVLTSDGVFDDVTATGRDVRMTASGLRAGTLRLEATLPFPAASRQVGGGTQLYAAHGGRVGVRRTESLLGRRVEIRATGTVRAEGGQLVIEPETVDLDGPQWLDAALSTAARRLVTIHHTVRGLPEGMRLSRAAVVNGGFRATLDGSGVVLTR